MQNIRGLFSTPHFLSNLFEQGAQVPLVVVFADELEEILLPVLQTAKRSRALKQVFCGTELNITQEGVPAAIPAEACYLGWQESLTLLAKLVEAEIPDQP